MGGHLARARSPGRPDCLELDPARARHAGRAVGRLAVLRARLAIARHAQPQHVHADRHGDRRRLALQRGRDDRARSSSRRPSAAWTARSPSISRRRPSSRCWCCSGRCWSSARRQTTSGAIRALLDLAPKTARKLSDDGSEEEVDLSAIEVGDRLRVRPGERVPVDGVVDRGEGRGRRIDGHRRVDAGHQGGRRPRASAAR